MYEGSPRSTFKQGIQEASRGAALAGGVTVVGTLIAGGLWPLLGAYISGTIGFSVLETFLSSLGGNALASWLSDMGKGGINKYLQGSKLEFAEAINKQLSSDKQFFQDVQKVFDQINITNVALKSLEDQSAEQINLIVKMSEDLQRYSDRHNIIHISLFEDVNDTLERVSREERELLARNHSEMVQRIEELHKRFNVYIEKGNQAAVENNFNGDIQTVYIADHIIINNPPPNPDQPMDILDALFPHRGRIV